MGGCQGEDEGGRDDNDQLRMWRSGGRASRRAGEFFCFMCKAISWQKLQDDIPWEKSCYMFVGIAHVSLCCISRQAELLVHLGALCNAWYVFIMVHDCYALCFLSDRMAKPSWKESFEPLSLCSQRKASSGNGVGELMEM